jgi:photosystem II stability/assembly factor-like uncharacterized protein
MINCVACCFLLLCSLCSSCATTYSNGSAARPVNERTPVHEKLMESVIRVKATHTRSGSSAWSVDEKRTQGRENLRSVYFLDANHGWVGGKGVLYKTTDGGKTWLSVGIDIPKEAFVKELFFQTESLGWLTIQQEATSPLTYQDNYYRLLRTTDGGTTWKTLLEDKDSILNRIRFSSTGEGWLIGFKYTNLEPLRTRDFILHTSDLGKTWKDVSETLNQILGAMPIKVEFTDIVTEGAGRASVLLPRGSIYKTDDAGRNWYRLNGTIDDSSYSCSCRLGVTNTHHVWIGGDKDDSHSVLGMVAVKDDDSWREYILFGVSFSDIQFLSRDRIVTGGSTTPNQQGYTVKREAVVSYSSDGGTSWSFIYHNPKVKKINALSAVDSDHVWAVGDDGLILRLTATIKTD